MATALQIQKATKKAGFGKIALIGPSGAGKTVTALRIARCLGDRIVVVDTEHRSASKYAGEWGDFDTIVIEDDYHPDRFIEAMELAQASGYDVIVIDSITHEWDAQGGVKAQKDLLDKKKPNQGFQNWRLVNPMHEAFIEAMLSVKAHVIATMHSKMGWAMNQEDGKTKVVKLGMEPVQRDGIEFNFDFIGDINMDHELVVQKTRCSALDGKVFTKPGPEVGDVLRKWLSEGEEEPVPRNTDDFLREHPPQDAPEAPGIGKERAAAIVAKVKAAKGAWPEAQHAALRAFCADLTTKHGDKGGDWPESAAQAFDAEYDQRKAEAERVAEENAAMSPEELGDAIAGADAEVNFDDGDPEE